MFAFVCNARVIVLLKAFVGERRHLSVNSSKNTRATFVVNKESGTTTTLV